jgi:hypothetical protein
MRSNHAPEQQSEVLPELLAHEAVDEAVAGAVEHEQEVADVANHQRPQRDGSLPGSGADLGSM